jgi:hypothetical protein
MNIAHLGAGHPLLRALQSSTPATKASHDPFGALSLFKSLNPAFAALPPQSLRNLQALTQLSFRGNHLRQASDMSARESSEHVATASHSTGFTRRATPAVEPKVSHKPVGSMTRSQALSALGYESSEDPTPSDINIEFNRKKHELLPENYDAMSTYDQVKAEKDEAVAPRLAALKEAADILKGSKKPLPE